MSPYHADIYVSNKESDDQDESYRYIVFAPDIRSALQKAVREAQKDGALLEVGRLQPNSAPHLRGATIGTDQYRFEYSREDNACTAEIEGPGDDGLWAQIEIVPVDCDDFWKRLDDAGDDLKLLKDWASKRRKAAVGVLGALQYARATEELSEHANTEEFISFLLSLYASGPVRTPARRAKHSA